MHETQDSPRGEPSDLAPSREEPSETERTRTWPAKPREVQAIVNSDSYAYELNSDTIETAYCAGRRVHRVETEGWRVAWTTAQQDYDTSETEHVEDCGDWHGKKLRRVIIHPRNWVYQTSRYGSGLHPAWEEDPRVEEARAKAQQEERNRKQAERDEIRRVGLEWLATAKIDDDDDFDTWESKGLTYQDIRAERKRRQESEAARVRDEEWARCVALVPEHATLIDDGAPAERGRWGVIPGRAPHVWYNVFISADWRGKDAETAKVVGQGLQVVGSLAYVAEWIKTGRVRIARPDEHVPPSAVLERIGHEHLKDIRRVEVDLDGKARVVWVGRPTFARDALVLDENGRIVRAKKIVAVALAGA
jgi:hypothetical protein